MAILVAAGDTLAEAIAVLRERFHSLAERMMVVVEALQAGVAPPADLAEEIQSSRNDFAALVTACSHLLAAELEPDISIDQLAERLRAYRQARIALQRGVRVLRQVVSLHNPREPEFPALDVVKDSAADLLTKVEDGMREGDLEAALTPYVDLLQFVAGAEGLPSVEWAATYQRVSESFGLEVAAAAARGHLIMARGQDQTAIDSELKSAAIGVTALPPERTDEIVARSGDDAGTAVAERESTRDQEGPTESEPPGVDGELLTEAAVPDVTAATSTSAATALAEAERQPVPAGPPGGGEVPTEGLDIGGAIWTFLSQKRAALAYHLARVATTQQLLPVGAPPPALLRALTLAPWLTRATGAVARDLQNCFGTEITQAGMTGALLIWAATVRPALLAPASGAAIWLRSIHWEDGWSDFFALSKEVAETGEVAQGINLNLLRGARGLAAWQLDLEQAQRDAQEWMEQAPAMHFLGPANGVWRKLVQRGGAITRLLAPVCSGRVPTASQVAEASVTLADRVAFRRLVDEIDRRLRPTNFERVHARALEQLVARTLEAVALAENWLAVIRRRPEQQDFVTSRVNALRASMQAREAAMADRLSTVATRGDAAGAAATLALATLCNLRTMLDEDGPVSAPEPDIVRLLGRDLLLLPEVDLDESWRPRLEPALRALARLAETPPNWERAFVGRLARLDFRGCERVTEVVEEEDDALAGRLRQQLAGAMEAARAEHDCEQERLGHEVEQALHAGLMGEAEHGELQGRIVEAGRLVTALDLRAAQAMLQQVGQQLETMRRRGVDDLAASLSQLSFDAEDPTRIRIEDAIAAGDLAAAHEYLDRVRRGQSILATKPEGQTRFETWRTWLQSVEASEESDARILSQVRAKQGRFGSLLAGLGPEEETTALQYLDAWFTLKNSRQFDARSVRIVLAALGFGPTRVNPVHPPTGRGRPQSMKASFSARAVMDRATCPVPTFGSVANGRYRIVFTPARMDNLSAALADGTGAQATLLFHFGRLDTAQRQVFVRQSRALAQSALLVDDWLALFLASRNAPRLPWFFSATLPYTVVQPYVTGTGVVPPEMFYGRQQELASLLDPNDGRCFVFGGRQLGKTALLREAQRRFHDPENGRIAIWLDLKTKGIGTESKAEELWSRLVPPLQKASVLTSSFHLTRSVAGHAEPIMEGVMAWLGDDPDRRILLLLDEADAFLADDGENGFPECYRLKGLMEQTNRHFKVVFAGLHNVVRAATEVENHPLAHLGQPVGVGPLVHNGEWYEARDLIRVPLESLGYQFTSPNLPVRIMAQTNYYPGLIQAYCAGLLSTLAERHSAGIEFRDGPPYLITSEHVNQAYNAHLREHFRERFSLTLRLDPRYEVITYFMAERFLSGEASISTGLTLREIAEGASYWWKEGFSKTLQRGDLRVLLGEMEVLGVTARIGERPARYTLRNPNILLLLGTREEVGNELLKERSAPPPFQAAHFHAAVSSWEDDPRHALTVQQEAQLHEPRSGITLLFGTEAAGFSPEQLHGLLRDSMGAERVRGKSASAFKAELKEIKVRQGGTTVAYVLPEDGWDAAWLRAAIAHTSGRSARTRHLRVLLVGGPEEAWSLTGTSESAFDEADVDIMTVRAWQASFLNRWAEDVQVSRQVRDGLDRATGGWWVLLKYLRDHQDSLDDLESTLKSEEGRKGFLKAFGLQIPEAAAGLQAVTRHCLGDGSLRDDDIPTVAEMENQTVEHLRRCLRWGGWIGLVADDSGTPWVIDPVVCRILSA